MIVLGVDSSAKSASCAVLKDDILQGESFLNNGYTHSETLLPMINNLLKGLKISVSDIDLFSVTAGPGSFTGVRIGIALIKGLAFYKNKPCVGVSSLQVLAQNIPYFDGIICSVMDARRNQVYNALFEYKGGEITRLTADRAISIAELEQELNFYNKNIILVGDGANLCYDNIKNTDKIIIANQGLLLSRGCETAKLGLSLYEKGQACSHEELKPVYLRLSQAERELLEKEQKAK